jgi:hypothetical protein
VIVDDICDGGGTFLGLAARLGEQDAGLLTLCVTHGLFTKGVMPLLDVFDRIYTFGDPHWEVAGLVHIPWETLYREGATS